MTYKKFRIALCVAGLLAIAILAAGCTAANQPGHISLSATEFDFGTIPNTHPVSQSFQVTNVGRGPLEISSVSTSCGCTTAEVTDRRLEAGEVTDLMVTFNPLIHKGQTGSFQRVVYIRSDDPDAAEVSLNFNVTVVNPQTLEESS
jgi:hypothetical protein